MRKIESYSILPKKCYQTKKINCIRNSFFKSNIFYNQRKIIDSDFIQKDIFYIEKIFEDKLCLKI